MDLIPYLSTIILIATIATILLAFVSYGALKLRDRRRPRASDTTPVFFRQYRLEDAPGHDQGGEGA